MFRKVLIANRGEIALRILRACRTLGAEAVVAYSEADRDSLPVQLADEAICIGPSEARRSYLSAPAVISAALVTGCDAIHPGYGFLSEDEGFAEVVARARPDVHRAVGGGPRAVRQQGRHPAAAGRPRTADDPGVGGDAARRRCTPSTRPSGSAIRSSSSRRPAAAARACAWSAPRASSNRCCASADRRPRRRSATTRSTSSAGWTRTATSRSRSPSTATGTASTCSSATARSSAATRRSSRRRRPRRCPTPPGSTSPSEPSARRCRAGYENVGTLEFLVDAAGDFYFIEINCRIQVEHPVTEMLTGLDLVAIQIRIAAGEPLGFSQADVRMQRPRHRVPDQRRGPRARLPARRRPRRAVPRAGRSGRAHGLAPVQRLRGPAVLRFAARQARRLGAGPGDRHRAQPRGARRAGRRRHRHQRDDPSGAARTTRRSSRAG